uniref:Uncharacterized protein n=1 Tax=Trichogramma kaykai TaxID=54128 RepID=A0ABD2VX80_9HYME
MHWFMYYLKNEDQLCLYVKRDFVRYNVLQRVFGTDFEWFDTVAPSFDPGNKMQNKPRAKYLQNVLYRYSRTIQIFYTNGAEHNCAKIFKIKAAAQHNRIISLAERRLLRAAATEVPGSVLNIRARDMNSSYVLGEDEDWGRRYYFTYYSEFGDRNGASGVERNVCASRFGASKLISKFVSIRYDSLALVDYKYAAIDTIDRTRSSRSSKNTVQRIATTERYNEMAGRSGAIYLAILVCLAMGACYVAGSSLQVGQRLGEGRDGLVCTSEIQEAAKEGRIVSARKRCRPRGCGQIITQIRILDRNATNMGGHGRVVSGGVGHPYAVVQLWSKKGVPLNFTIEAYAKPYWPAAMMPSL